jgi:photosystem II stability/assembly factor-like uncharacterized protein
MKVTAYAASIGHSVWFSHDLGESWARAHTPTGGFYNESRCWSLSVHPGRPGEVLAGTDQGIYRWTPAGKRWTHLPSPMDGLHIHQLAQAPHDPDVIFAGTRPAQIFRSLDGGRRWVRCPLPSPAECEFINTTRVTSMHFDPKSAESIWVTVEIDGVYRSDDYGHTWKKLINGLRSPDTHNLVFFERPEGTVVLCSTEEGLHRSTDNGETWEYIEVPQAPWPYFRCIRKRADDCGIVFLAIGDRPSGTKSMMLRSRDFGSTWESVDLPVEPNTTIWAVTTNAADPMLIFACTIFGQIFRSTDGGENWVKMKRELGELRMIAWQPSEMSS